MQNNNFTPGFRTANNTFPIVLYSYHLMDCLPNGKDKLYTMINHSDDQEYMDNHDADQEIEFQIPDRTAFYQLMDDLLLTIHDEIQGYLKINTDPRDDASNDIWEAISLLDNMGEYDTI